MYTTGVQKYSMKKLMIINYCQILLCKILLSSVLTMKMFVFKIPPENNDKSD